MIDPFYLMLAPVLGAFFGAIFSFGAFWVLQEHRDAKEYKDKALKVLYAVWLELIMNKGLTVVPVDQEGRPRIHREFETSALQNLFGDASYYSQEVRALYEIYMTLLNLNQQVKWGSALAAQGDKDAYQEIIDTQEKFIKEKLIPRIEPAINSIGKEVDKFQRLTAWGIAFPNIFGAETKYMKRLAKFKKFWDLSSNPPT